MLGDEGHAEGLIVGLMQDRRVPNLSSRARQSQLDEPGAILGKLEENVMRVEGRRLLYEGIEEIL